MEGSVVPLHGAPLVIRVSNTMTGTDSLLLYAILAGIDRNYTAVVFWVHQCRYRLDIINPTPHSTSHRGPYTDLLCPIPSKTPFAVVVSCWFGWVPSRMIRLWKKILSTLHSWVYVDVFIHPEPMGYSKGLRKAIVSLFLLSAFWPQSGMLAAKGLTSSGHQTLIK
jgi:hypothetical protein